MGEGVVCFTFSESLLRKRRSTRWPPGSLNSTMIAPGVPTAGSSGTDVAKSIFSRAISCE